MKKKKMVVAIGDTKGGVKKVYRGDKVVYKKKAKMIKKLPSVFNKKKTLIIDIGCGENKRPGALGVDFREAPGVDVIQDLSLFPWNSLPSEVADVVTSSHLLEHITPNSPDPRLAGLLDLLLEKGVVTKGEVDKNVGDYRFLGGFMRFMDECWRITKPGGQFIATFPFAGSPGFWQDPTHVNGITPTTLAYFDPLAKEETSQQYYGLYQIYRPMPWKILRCFYDVNGFMEICLEKRRIDASYKVSKESGMNTK